MAKEIERKFLVVNDGWKAGVSTTNTFLQAYIATGDDRSKSRYRLSSPVRNMNHGPVIVKLMPWTPEVSNPRRRNQARTRSPEERRNDSDEPENPPSP